MIKANILVVEHEISASKTIQNILLKLGYTVIGNASSGQEAIRQVAEYYPDLVIMNIKFKTDIDGIEATQKINMPIIFLADNADKKTLERVEGAEQFCYLTKPFKPRELQTLVEINLLKYRTEIKLKESQEWLTTVLKSISDAVITSDGKGAVTFINPVAEVLTGWKQEDVIGRNITEVFRITNENNCTGIESPVTQALSGITVRLPNETLLIARNGKEIPIDDSAVPIKDSFGNITGTVLVFQDLTERKRTQEIHQKQIEQSQTVAELERINQLKEEFLSTVSHELRTPLANMKMAIQMLKNFLSTERGQRYLEILQAECTRETELINDFLDLQRLESAFYPSFCPEALLLQEWLPSLVEPFRTRTQARQQNLKVNIPPDLHPLISDRASLERLLAELLNNACKYTAADGEIVLSVSHKSSIPITPDSQPATIFTISNQAEIPPDQLPRIFEKFYRVPKADRWKQGGTGLGLAIVQKLVEQLQGSIEVKSGEGWTTFTIELNTLAIATYPPTC